MFAKFEYWQSEEDAQWYFQLRAPYNGIIIQSAGYMTKEECLEGIDQVRRYADIAIVTQSPMVSIV